MNNWILGIWSIVLLTLALMFTWHVNTSPPSCACDQAPIIFHNFEEFVEDHNKLISMYENMERNVNKLQHRLKKLESLAREHGYLREEGSVLNE